MDTWVWTSILAAIIAAVLLYIYVRTVLTLKRVLFDLYDPVSKMRALLSVLFPWRAVVLLHGDLKVKNRAIDLARGLGMDMNDLITMAEEEV